MVLHPAEPLTGVLGNVGPNMRPNSTAAPSIAAFGILPRSF